MELRERAGEEREPWLGRRGSLHESWHSGDLWPRYKNPLCMCALEGLSSADAFFKERWESQAAEAALHLKIRWAQQLTGQLPFLPPASLSFHIVHYMTPASKRHTLLNIKQTPGTSTISPPACVGAHTHTHGLRSQFDFPKDCIILR